MSQGKKVSRSIDYPSVAHIPGVRFNQVPEKLYFTFFLN